MSPRGVVLMTGHKWTRETVDNFFQGYAVSPAETDASSFSWRPCPACGGCAGDRHPVTIHNPASGDVDELDVCTDCLVYIANGETPEATSDG